MRLTFSDTKCEISAQGAGVISLICQGVDILFPTQMIGEKLRGGIPLCAPVFGPGEMVGLKQHGFARNIMWRVVEQSANEAKLTPVKNKVWDENVPSEFRGCDMAYGVSLSQNTLQLTLTITNIGDMPFACSPGFHPYFPTRNASKCMVLENAFADKQLLDTQFLADQKTVTLETEDTTVTLASEAMQHYAVWSANPDKYICVEPTYGGYLEHQSAVPMLEPGDSKTYTAQISWERKP